MYRRAVAVGDAKSNPMAVGAEGQQQKQRDRRDGDDVASAPRTRQMLLSVTLESAQVIRFELVGDGHMECAQPLNDAATAAKRRTDCNRDGPPPFAAGWLEASGEIALATCPLLDCAAR